MSFKRFYLACIMGVLAGLVCVMFATSNNVVPLKVIAAIFTGRVLIGFVIGISGLKINWALHGLFIGMVVSIPGGFAAMMSATAQFGKWEMFAMSVVLGMIYGFIIELVTSVFFKAKQK